MKPLIVHIEKGADICITLKTIRLGDVLLKFEDESSLYQVINRIAEMLSDLLDYRENEE